MEDLYQHQSIREWAEDDRPREKLLNKGKQVLSDAELLAILIGSGTRGASALDLAKNLLRHVDGNLHELSKASPEGLINSIKGIGPAKAITLLAALELGNRRRTSEIITRPKITSSRDAYEFFKSRFGDSPYEEFWILVMDRSNQIRKSLCISEGGISGTVADPKKIFQIALEQKGAALILCHNHPSGNPRPSEADIHLTRKMKESGKILDLPVIDHIILGEEKYFSFADEGML